MIAKSTHGYVLHQLPYYVKNTYLQNVNEKHELNSDGMFRDLDKIIWRGPGETAFSF